LAPDKHQWATCLGVPESLILSCHISSIDFGRCLGMVLKSTSSTEPFYRIKERTRIDLRQSRPHCGHASSSVGPVAHIQDCVAQYASKYKNTHSNFTPSTRLKNALSCPLPLPNSTYQYMPQDLIIAEQPLDIHTRCIASCKHFMDPFTDRWSNSSISKSPIFIGSLSAVF
jgi:hypothetical protein